MIQRLRIKLALWFFSLVMAAYILASMASVWSMFSRLNISTDNDLAHMCEEIAPAVDYTNKGPTLANWIKAATRRHILARTTVQIFGADEKLLESYGAKGIEELKQGKFRNGKDNENISVYSHYLHLPDGGFVQVQLPTAPFDQIIIDFILNECLRSIPLALLLAVFGWFYSGRAVAPVAKSLNTLRNFVDDAGHELNTPIALIENSIETIDAYLRDHNLPTDVLKIIQRASKTLKGMSQNLLLLAKMEQPHVELKLSPINLAELVIDISEDFLTPARAKQIDLQVHIDSQSDSLKNSDYLLNSLANIIVLGNRDTLTEVFNNLIDNAIRYTVTGGQIYIYSFRTENNICVAVRDTGCGIPKDCLANVFDRFYRVDKARSKSEGGNGLGLSIVRAIVNAHKGSVRVESILGKGSTFFVTLPMIDSKQLKMQEESMKRHLKSESNNLKL
jgi:signal transduction histidine kinase